MRVLFAVSNEEVSQSIIKKYQKQYKQIISSKNVYYFNAILKELQKDKSYDRIVIGEDLESFTHTQYDQIDKFIFEKLDGISDEAVSPTGKDIPIILICSDRRTKSEDMLVKLFGIGIYNAIIGNDRSVEEVCRLINRPRTKKEAKTYYQIESEDVNYQSESENDVSEVELQNILAHYKRLGKNEDKYIESFDNIASQYNDTQLRIISKFLPLNVRAVLEERSPKYQQIMSYNNKVSDKLRKPKKEESGTSAQLLKPKTRDNILSGPVVIPSSVNMNSTKKLSRLKRTNQPKFDIAGATETNRPMYPPVNQQARNQQFETNQVEMMQPKINNQEIHQTEPIAQTKINNQIETANQFRPVEQSVEPEQVEEPKPVKRKRGRPRKNPLPEETAEVQPVKRRRGRPRKNPLPEETKQVDEASEPKESNSKPAMEPILPGLSSIDSELNETTNNTENSGINQNNNVNSYNSSNNNINNYNTSGNSEMNGTAYSPYVMPGGVLSNNGYEPQMPPVQNEPTENYNNYNDGYNNYSNNNNYNDNSLNNNYNNDDYNNQNNNYSNDNYNSQVANSYSNKETNEGDLNNSISGSILNNDTYNSSNENNYDTVNNNYGSINNNFSSTNNSTGTGDKLDLTQYISSGKKIASFVGTSKNGTSFIVNTLAEMLSTSGIDVAILDATENRNSYYIYTKNEEELRNVAEQSIRNLKLGVANGINVHKNLTVYTDLPNGDRDIEYADQILDTLLKKHTLVLIDTDFKTPLRYFEQSQEIYLVQSLDVLTIQPLTAFLRELKAKNILEDGKLKIVLNKVVKIRGISDKTIIGGMAYYTDPAMSYMTELFDRTLIQYVSIPFEDETYIKYLENVIECNVSLKGYSKVFLQALKELGNMVYSVGGKTYRPPSVNNFNSGNTFSPGMTQTLNQMKNNNYDN